MTEHYFNNVTILNYAKCSIIYFVQTFQPSLVLETFIYKLTISTPYLYPSSRRSVRPVHQRGALHRRHQFDPPERARQQILHTPTGPTPRQGRVRHLQLGLVHTRQPGAQSRHRSERTRLPDSENHSAPVASGPDGSGAAQTPQFEHFQTAEHRRSAEKIGRLVGTCAGHDHAVGRHLRGGVQHSEGQRRAGRSRIVGATGGQWR